MSRDAQNIPPRLGKSFWFVLLAPPIVCAAGNTLIAAQVEVRYAMDCLMMVGLFGGFILNFVCSRLAARQLISVRGPNPYAQGGVLPWSVGFFLMNLIMCVGGCGLTGVAMNQ